MNVNFVYITAGSPEEAHSIGRVLVTSKLAACVNILNDMNSIYMWDGKVQTDSEVVMIVKTTEKLLPDLVDKVKSLHSYECPCIVAIPVSGGNPAFLDWIAAETD